MSMFGRPKLNALLGSANSFLPEDNPRPANVLDETLSRYPALQNYGPFGLKQSPRHGANMLEFYPPSEEDSFDPSRPSVETYGNAARPQDVAGDIVSHFTARGPDPVASKYYQDFQQSLTPEQNGRLQEQYQWARKNEGETRPYDEWAKVSGLPAYFRGYAFGQWKSPRLYNDQQRGMFDKLNAYLKSGKP